MGLEYKISLIKNEKEGTQFKLEFFGGGEPVGLWEDSLRHLDIRALIDDVWYGLKEPGDDEKFWNNLEQDLLNIERCKKIL